MTRPDTADKIENRPKSDKDDNNMVERMHLVNFSIQELRKACKSDPDALMREVIIMDQTITNLQNADGGKETMRFKNDLARINAGVNPDGKLGEHILPYLVIEGVDENGHVLVKDLATKQHERLIADNGVLNPEAISDKSANDKMFATASVTDAQSWKQSVNSDAVSQGILADCYFLSALESLAHKSPESIKNMITDNGPSQNGRHSYTVTFPGFSDKPVTVTEPNAYETTVFAQDKVGLWTNIVEKAHRKLIGQSLHDNGDTGYNGMKFLSSDRPTIVNFTRHPDDIDDTLKLANDAKTMMTATTIAPDSVRDKNGNLIEVERSHLYEVISYDEKNGTVTVANPWGSNYLDTRNAPDSKLKEDPNNAYDASRYDKLRNEIYPSSSADQQTGRYLTMTVDEFKSRFVEITYGSINE